MSDKINLANVQAARANCEMLANQFLDEYRKYVKMYSKLRSDRINQDIANGIAYVYKYRGNQYRVIETSACPDTDIRRSVNDMFRQPVVKINIKFIKNDEICDSVTETINVSRDYYGEYLEATKEDGEPDYKF